MAENNIVKSDYAAGRAALEGFGIDRIRIPGDWIVESITPESSYTRYSQGINAIGKGRLGEALVKLVQSAKMYTNCALSPQMIPEMKIKVLKDAHNSYLVAQGIASELELDNVEKAIRQESAALKRHLYEDLTSFSSPELDGEFREKHSTKRQSQKHKHPDAHHRVHANRGKKRH